MADLEVLCRTSTIHIPPEGGSPEPVREASAGPGQNLWRPGPKARRRHQPSRRKTTVGRLNGRPFYGQAKGQLRPTCTSYAGCAHQPSGILESTAQVPVPIPTAPKGACTLKPQRGLSIKSKSTASAVLLPIFIPYDVQWLLSPVPRRGDGDGWGGS